MMKLMRSSGGPRSNSGKENAKPRQSGDTINDDQLEIRRTKSDSFIPRLFGRSRSQKNLAPVVVDEPQPEIKEEEPKEEFYSVKVLEVNGHGEEQEPIDTGILRIRSEDYEDKRNSLSNFRRIRSETLPQQRPFTASHEYDSDDGEEELPAPRPVSPTDSQSSSLYDRILHMEPVPGAVRNRVVRIGDFPELEGEPANRPVSPDNSSAKTTRFRSDAIANKVNKSGTAEADIYKTMYRRPAPVKEEKSCLDDPNVKEVMEDCGIGLAFLCPIGKFLGIDESLYEIENSPEKKKPSKLADARVDDHVEKEDQEDSYEEEDGDDGTYDEEESVEIEGESLQL